jgi:hypothetical protein
MSDHVLPLVDWPTFDGAEDVRIRRVYAALIDLEGDGEDRRRLEDRKALG